MRGRYLLTAAAAAAAAAAVVAAAKARAPGDRRRRGWGRRVPPLQVWCWEGERLSVVLGTPGYKEGGAVVVAGSLHDAQVIRPVLRFVPRFCRAAL